MTELTEATEATEVMDRPWRLGIVGVGVGIGLIARLLAANDVGELTSSSVSICIALSCAMTGTGLALTATQRDRFDTSLWWLAASTAMAYAALTWISPPFTDTTDTWDNTQQATLALIGLGVGLLIAGIVALALVRRIPTLTIALTLLSGTFALAANTVFLRSEWGGIVLLAIAFGLVLIAWDRSPRREEHFEAPSAGPRTSRAGLSLAVVVLCGTGLQLWISRGGVPRGLPALLVCCALIVTAFSSMYRVRREFQRRETPLSEWTSWMHEIRTNDFQEELEGFAIGTVPISFDLPHHPELDVPSIPGPVPAVTERDIAAFTPTQVPAPVDGIPRISVPEPDIWEETRQKADQRAGRSPGSEPIVDWSAATRWATTEPETATLPGVFSTQIGLPLPSSEAATPIPDAQPAPAIDDIADLERWLAADSIDPSADRLFVAIEAMALDQHDAFDAETRSRLRAWIAATLRSAEPDAELVATIDGPYFMLVYRSMPQNQLMALNKRLRRILRQPINEALALNGTLAMLRPASTVELDELVDEAVIGLIQARQIEAASRPATN